MWIYTKRFQHPVDVKKTDLALAKNILTQFGGPDGELAASMRYLSQRYTMPTGKTKALLTDIGTEELAHMEMVSALVYQLTVDADPEEIEGSAFAPYYAIHGKGIYPAASTGEPFTAAYFQSTNDLKANLHEDMAAEQKARAAYENLMNLTDDPAVLDVLGWLREREVVHFQRFGEALTDLYDQLDNKRSFHIDNRDNEIIRPNKDINLTTNCADFNNMLD
ncbi:manganese catalase family protein [Haloplasma contractile]|uniref:CotJC protein n=1 Tax=Haloplasma contractile SSD-17B TaxID=1033810 RepID=U2ECK1_9MOLU|nr:manganese catalase family protein [Haloplasma contractile]ERJ12491.1 CotJC protein [Haloplasma contractile SSD-17B]